MPPKRSNKKPIREEDVLSDDEPKTITLTKEQRLTSKFIIIDCPLCSGKIQLRNEIEINPKGIKCSCNPCSFKRSRNDKTVNVSRDDQGEIKKTIQYPFPSTEIQHHQVMKIQVKTK